MRLLFIFFFLLPITLSAQESYFHELKGLEDSTGNTHLFYRLFVPNPGCFLDTDYSDNIWHFDLYNNLDSIIIEDFSESTISDSICTWSFQSITEYEPSPHNPERVLFSGSSPQITRISFLGITNTSYDINTFFNPSNYLEYDIHSSSYFFGNAGLSESLELVSAKLPLTQIENSDPPLVLGIYGLDSLAVDFLVTDVHPKKPNTYFSIDQENGNLKLSVNDGVTFNVVEDSLVDWREMSELYFDPDTNFVYSSGKIGDSFHFLRSDNNGNPGSWTIIKEDTTTGFLTGSSSELFISLKDELFVSEDGGESFEFTFQTNAEITGLYKKPSSPLLYMLTRTELFEYNTETQETTSLKRLPVSIAEEYDSTPSSVKLHQNYPNPFNPNTIISFELDKSTEIRLTIFNALGRIVTELVNERRTAGIHEVNFDASGLSSGIYFYRLEAGDFSETKRLTLIK